MRRLLLLALPLALMACGSDSDTTVTVATLAGTWNLTTANGAALPFTITTTPAKVELLSVERRRPLDRGIHGHGKHSDDGERNGHALDASICRDALCERHPGDRDDHWIGRRVGNAHQQYSVLVPGSHDRRNIRLREAVE